MSYICSSDEETGLELVTGDFPQQQKRAVHNKVEKRRKDKINTWIVKIGELLPEKDPKKQSKNCILERALELIVYLKEINRKLLTEQCSEVQAEEVARLQKQVNDLEIHNKSYLKLLRKAGISPMIPLEDELWQPKCGKYPKKLTPEQASALQSRLTQNGTIINGNNNSTKNKTIAVSVTNEILPTINSSNSSSNSSSDISNSDLVVSSINSTVRPSLVLRNNTEQSSSVNIKCNSSSANVETLNTVRFPQSSQSQMVITRALPAEPLMSTIQNVSTSTRQQPKPCLPENTLVEMANMVTTPQSPIILFNEQGLPVVQNMLSFQNKPIVLGGHTTVPIISQQYGGGLNQNGSQIVPTSIVMSGNQLSASKIPLANGLVIRPQEPLASDFLNQNFCGQRDGSITLCAPPNDVSVLSANNNGMSNAMSLPLMGQMAFNQQGQMITLGPGTLLTTPSAPGMAAAQQPWPSALLLPNGQIIPVVSQPSVMYTANQPTLSNGLVLASPAPKTTGISVHNYQQSQVITTPTSNVQLNTVRSTVSYAVLGTNTTTVFSNQNANAKALTSNPTDNIESISKTPTCNSSGKKTNQHNKKPYPLSGKAVATKKRAPTKQKVPEKSKAQQFLKSKPEKLTRPKSTPLPNNNSSNPTVTLSSTPPANFTLSFEPISSMFPSNKDSNRTECVKEISPTTNTNATNNNNLKETDILAKATESIFSTNMSDLSPTMPNFHPDVDEINAINKNKSNQNCTETEQVNVAPTFNEHVNESSTYSSSFNSNVLPINNNVSNNTGVLNDSSSIKKKKDPLNNSESEPVSKKARNETKEKSNVYGRSNGFVHLEEEKELQPNQLSNPPFVNMVENENISTTSQTQAFSTNISTSTHRNENRNSVSRETECHSSNVIESFGSNPENTDHELPALILSSLGDDSDAPSSVNSNSNSGLQFLALSPTEHYSSGIGNKNVIEPQNSFPNMTSNQPSTHSISFSGTTHSSNIVNHENNVANNFLEENICHKTMIPNRPQILTTHSDILADANGHKNSSSAVSSTIHNSSPINIIPVNQRPPSIHEIQSCKQPPNLTHLSVTTSFLNTNTNPIVANKFHGTSSTSSSGSPCSSSSVTRNATQCQLPSPVNGLGFGATSTPPLFSRPPFHAPQNHLHTLMSVPATVSSVVSSQTTSTTFAGNSDKGSNHSQIFSPLVPNNPCHKPMHQPPLFNQPINRHLSNTTKSIEPPTVSNHSASVSIHNARSLCNSNVYTNSNQIRAQIRPSISTAHGGNHILSNYSAEALIGHQPSHTSAPDPFYNASQNTSSCTQQLQVSQSLPYPRSSNRTLLPYSAESLLQNQTYTDRKRDSNNRSLNHTSYNQHFNQVASISGAHATQNGSFPQPFFSPNTSLSTPIVSSAASLTVNSSIGHSSSINYSTASGPTYSSVTSQQNFTGNHFTNGPPFLMRHIPHVPDVNHPLHNTSQAPFTLGDTISQNNNFTSRSLVDSVAPSSSLNCLQTLPPPVSIDMTPTQQQTQGNGCLFPPHNPHSVHPGALLPPIPEPTFPLLTGPSMQSLNCGNKNDTSMLNHFPQTSTQNHLVNNFFPGHFVPTMSATGNTHSSSHHSRNNINNTFMESGKKENRIHGSNARSPIPSNKSSPSKSSKSASKKKSSVNVEVSQSSVPTITSSYEKSRAVPYFAIPELTPHSDMQACSVNRFLPDSQRHSVPMPPNSVHHPHHHHHQQQSRINPSLVPPPVVPHPPSNPVAPDLPRNSPYNPLFRAQTQSSLNLNFQPPSFAINSLPRVPISGTVGCDTRVATNNMLPPSNNMAPSTGSSTHVPNFNLSNIFPDISTSSESISLNPMKFHPSNSIIPHHTTHPSVSISSPMTQSRVDNGHLTNGQSHQSRVSSGPAPPLYHSRTNHGPAPTPVMHNSFNGILGPSAHSFDSRTSSQMVMGIGNTVAPPPHFGHASGHGAPFGNVLPTLNFSVHDPH